MKNRNNILLASVAVIALGGVAIGAFAYASSNLLSACVKKNGEVRLIVPGFTKNEDCEHNSEIVSWNIQGEKGDKGEAGAEAKQLHVVGLDGTDYGRLVGTELYGSNLTMLVSYYEPEKVLLKTLGTQYNVSFGYMADQYEIMYENSDCTGPSYVSESDAYSDGMLIKNSSRTFALRYGSLNAVSIKSISDKNSSACSEISEQLISGYKAEEIILPPTPVRTLLEQI